MPDVPVSVVVDCAAWGAQHLITEADAWQAKATSANATDPQFAARCAHRAATLRDQARAALHTAGHNPDEPPPVETYRPLTTGELEQRARDEAAAPEHARAQLRAERNARLQAADWTELPGVPLDEAQRAAWRTYRQALRDLPDTADPTNPTWPTPPNQ